MRRQAFALLLALSAVGGNAQPTGSQQIAEFFLPPERVQRQFVASIPAARQQNPELADDLQHVAAKFDGKLITGRIADVLDSSLSAGDKRYIQAFIGSAPGRALGLAQRESDGQAAQRALNRLPKSQQQEIGNFLTSATGQKLLNVLNSDEVSLITQRYGSELRCAYLAQAKPAQYEALRTEGRCPRVMVQ